MSVKNREKYGDVNPRHVTSRGPSGVGECDDVINIDAETDTIWRGRPLSTRFFILAARTREEGPKYLHSRRRGGGGGRGRSLNTLSEG